MPGVKLALQCRHLLYCEVIGGCGGVVCVQDPSEDAGHAEERKGAREASVLAGKGRLEALFGDIFIIRIRWVFYLQVLLLEHLGET